MLAFAFPMDTRSFAPLLLTLFTELIDGSWDPSGRTYVLNQGDGGPLAALDRLSAAAASGARGGPSIAAHVDPHPLRAVAAQPVGERLAAALAGHGLDRELGA